jgi:hypothetical protein
MTPVGGTLAPAHEVDDARWISAEEAPKVLSYEHDRVLLEPLRQLVGRP